MDAEQLTEYLHRHIPLTAALGAVVVCCSETDIEIRAPFAPNVNHRGTVFGGSLATLGILSGWAVLHLALRREQIEARLVIQKSQTDFAEPVEGEFSAASRLPVEAWPHFLKTLHRYKRARILVPTEIRVAGRCAVTHSGTYVALL